MFCNRIKCSMYRKCYLKEAKVMLPKKFRVLKLSEKKTFLHESLEI